MKCNICGNTISKGDNICQVCGAIQNIDAFAEVEYKPAKPDDNDEEEAKPSVSSMHFGRPKEESNTDYDNKLKQLLQETMNKKHPVKKSPAKPTEAPPEKTVAPPKADPIEAPKKTTTSALGSSPLTSKEDDQSSEQLKDVLQTIFKSKQEKAEKKQPKQKQQKTPVASTTPEKPAEEVSSSAWDNDPTPEQDEEFQGFERSEEVVQEDQWSMGENNHAENLPTDPDPYDGSKDFPEVYHEEATLPDVQTEQPVTAFSTPDNKPQTRTSELAETVFDPPTRAIIREDKQEISFAEETPASDTIIKEDTEDIINDEVFDDIQEPIIQETAFEIEEPRSNLVEEVYEMHVTVASSMRRFIASALDILFSFVLLLVFMGVAVRLVGSADLPQDTNSGLFYIISLAYNHPHLLPAYGLLLFAIWALIGLVCTTTTGQTPGKMIMGIKVIKSDGERVNLVHGIVRLLGYVLSTMPFFLGFLWVVVNTEKQGLHDKLAQTYVIRIASK